MGTHPIFESDFDCLTEQICRNKKSFNSSSFKFRGRRWCPGCKFRDAFRAGMADDLLCVPDLVGSRDTSPQPIILNQLRHVIAETRIRTRQKFHTFFDESFDKNEKLQRLEYDQDSIVFVSDEAQLIDFNSKPNKSNKRKSSKVESKAEVIEINSTPEVIKIDLEPEVIEIKSESTKSEPDVS